MKRVVVFCGSSCGARELYSDFAKSLAEALCQHEISLVYGGAKVGLMGVLADTMLDLGGEVYGVIPQKLIDVELAHQRLSKLYTVNTMHERKAKMASLADGVILLPGGAGSLDEFFEMMTWAQLGFHQKPLGILNINDYFSHLLLFLDKAVSEEFLNKSHRQMLIVKDNPLELITAFKNYKPQFEQKWR
jgi:uncharacterized protein (TIGR00730 family)